MTTVTGKRVILKNLQNEYLIPFTDQGGSGNPDGETITLNDQDQLQTIAVKDNRSNSPIKVWTGTRDQYDAIITKDPTTIYNITDDLQDFMTKLSYPNIGEIVSSTLPLTDAGLHLLDGSVLSGGGIYHDFVDYIANLHSSSSYKHKKFNISTTGGLTNNNGVLSNFSSNNYAKLPKLFSPGNNSWEIQFKFTTGSSFDPDYYQYILNTNQIWQGIGIGISTERKLSLESYTYASNPQVITGTRVLDANTTYYARINYSTSTGYTLKLGTSLDNLVTDATYSSDQTIPSGLTLVLGVDDCGSYGVPFNGSIDLNESYIKINDSLFWEGVTYVLDGFMSEKISHTLNTNFTQVGGSLSGYTFTGGSGSYIQLPQQIPFATAESWYVRTKYTYQGGGVYPTIFGSGNGDMQDPLVIVYGGYINFILTSSPGSWNITAPGTTAKTDIAVQAGVTYWLEFGYDGANYYLNYNTDGSDHYTQALFVSSSIKSYQGANPSLFLNAGANIGTYYSSGSLDLEQTCIYVNGSLFWSGANEVKATPDQAWQAEVEQYGVCGKFVYDSANNAVRLPKITKFIEGTVDPAALGSLVEAGLPNITGSISQGVQAGGTNSGALYRDGTITGVFSGASSQQQSLKLDASRSSSIYGNSSTVQPQAIKVLYYVVVATTTKTDIEVDIDQIATDLNGKADTNLSNVTNIGKRFITEMGLPSNTYVPLTIGTDGTEYTAPADGYVSAVFTLSTQARSYLDLVTYVNGTVLLYSRGVSETLGDYLGTWIPVRKGQEFTLHHFGFNISNNTCFLNFIYAQGSVWEAS